MYTNALLPGSKLLTEVASEWSSYDAVLIIYCKGYFLTFLSWPDITGVLGIILKHEVRYYKFLNSTYLGIIIRL